MRLVAPPSGTGLSRGLALAGLCAALTLGGCATPQNPDPLEPLNRKVFAFNDKVDEAVLKPVATAWRDVVPQPVRTGVSNVFANVKDIWSGVNLVLQGRFVDGASDFLRFGTNTVFGLLGVFDVATPLGLERHGEDFGQTLGKWGFGPGAYIVWPFLGPSTVRDSVGIPLEWQADPFQYVDPVNLRYSMTAVKFVNLRADLLEAGRMVDGIALDKYVFFRNAYLQRRRSLVYDGNPPEEEAAEERWDLPETPAAPAPAASAPRPALTPASGTP